MSRTESSISEWESSMIGIQDQPFNFQLRTIVANPEVKNSEGSLIPLESDLNIPTLWKAKTFPREKGWNELILQQDTTEVLQFISWPILEVGNLWQLTRRCR